MFRKILNANNDKFSNNKNSDKYKCILMENQRLAVWQVK